MLTFLVPKDLLMILERTIVQVMDDASSSLVWLLQFCGSGCEFCDAYLRLVSLIAPSSVILACTLRLSLRHAWQDTSRPHVSFAVSSRGFVDC
jgi:hypothetical protein